MSDSPSEQDSGETTQRSDAGSADRVGSGSSGGNLAYRAVMLAIVAVGAVAVVAGIAGTFFALTGSLDGGEEYDILGEYECEEFDGDPQVVHETDYEIERQVLNPSEVSDFHTSATGEGVNITLETKGVLLDASANEPDGQLIPVDTADDAVVVQRNTTQPFRLWVDSVAEDGTVTRMQLDICPP